MTNLAVLRDFSRNAGADLRSSLDNAASALAKKQLSGTVAIAVTGGARRNLLRANLGSPTFEEVPDDATRGESCDFMVYVEENALMEILRGELSPLTAFLRGRLRYTGDRKLGLAIFRELATTHDAVFEPCRDPRLR